MASDAPADAAPDTSTAPEPDFRISPRDYDLMIRTVAGEAGGQPDVGQVAVGHVILNRLVSGQYGGTVRDVVLAPSQFEPWQRNPRGLMGMSPDSPQYTRAQRAVDAVLSGEAPDPTEGATHFYAPKAQAALGRAPPKWGRSGGQQIFDHVFFAPNGPVPAYTSLGGRPASSPSATASPAASSPAAGPSIMPVTTKPEEMGDDELEGLLLGRPSRKPAQSPTSGRLSAEAVSGRTNAGTPSPADPGGSAPLAITIRPSGTAGTSAPADPASMSDDDLEKLLTGGATAANLNTPAPKAGAPSRPQIGREAQGWADRVGAFAAGATDLPIVGPAIQNALISTAAGVGSTLRGTSYDDEKRLAGNKLLQLAQDYPGTRMAGQLYGSVAAMAPLAATAPGAAALGMGEGGIIGRTAASALTGAGMGSTDAAVRGQDAQAGALSGLIGGSIAPGAGQALGWAGNKLLAAVNSVLPEGASLNALTNVLKSSGRTPNELQAEMAANPRLAAMDLDPALQQQAMGLATQPGRARSTLAAAAENRASTAPGAVANVFDDALGAIGSPVAIREGLTETAKTNAQRGFGEALAGAEPISLDGMSRSATQKISNTWTRVLERFPDKTQQAFTQPEQMHLVQQELGREAETLARSAVGTERLAAGPVYGVRQQLVDRIDAATGGKFKPAQKQFADDKAVGEAFDDGMSWRRNRSGSAGLDDHPDALRRWWNGASDAEQEAYRQGMRADIEQAVGSVRNAARKGAAVPEVDFNKAKLDVVLGKDEADRVVRLLGDEQKIAGTNAKLFAGSQTAPRQAAEKSVAVQDMAGAGAAVGLPTFFTLSGQPGAAAATTAATLGALALRAGRRSLNVSRNSRLAEALSASGPEGQAVMNRLMSYAAPGGNVPAFARGIAPGTNLLLRAGAGQFR